MKSNSLLTYLLYALLAALILSAGYKACQMQKEKQLKAKEEAEWQETLKKLYPENDTTAGGSAFVNRDSATQTTGANQGTSTTGGTKTSTATQPKATTTTTPSSTGTTTTPKTTTKGGSTVQGVGSGRWEVRAGTFQYMDGARSRLEEVIRMGYTNAEIKKTSNGWAAVIVMRTNDKNKAIQVVDQLERRGVDAAVFKR
ncbi:MAG: hypothetical protein DYG98_23690 [Haliscomenobacteraceae bacterium CHB4]|nr:hypothetical protein [Saprospiraceae bacterium]MCE7926062.1 hypothetical protein [Haliscomenobacteraceae bacterium CHB4]